MKWISVKDRLPDEGKDILFSTEGMVFAPKIYRGEYKQGLQYEWIGYDKDGDENWMISRLVSLWQYITPPKEDV